MVYGEGWILREYLNVANGLEKIAHELQGYSRVSNKYIREDIEVIRKEIVRLVGRVDDFTRDYIQDLSWQSAKNFYEMMEDDENED